MTFLTIRKSSYSRLISLCVMVTFATSMVISPKAQAGVMGLPQPGTMVDISPAYVPLMITGLSVHPENPLLMDFIVSTGNSGMNADQVKKQSDRLIKYFLACLTIPENDQWVNLSPYEKQRIVPEDLGKTVLGQDMLAQDYLLKQLTASLIYPEKNLGKDFWDKVYAKANQMYGTTNIPVNTFNKVWILPDTAKVYEHKDTVFVVKSHLKVMLDADYLALSKHASDVTSETKQNQVNNLGNQVIRQIVLPAIEQEVNTGKNFAQMRQIYNSMILAVWFKKNLKEALLNQVYTDKSKVNGVNVDDPAIKEKIYRQYIQAYRKGVFNYIKEEVDQNSQETIPRKYFSGGLTPVRARDLAMATVDEAMASVDNMPAENKYFTVKGRTDQFNSAMTAKLEDLLGKSSGLVDRLEAANRSGSTEGLDAALEEARVSLPGSSPHNSPYLLAFKTPETTETVDVTKLSIGEIQQKVAPYLNFTLSTEDAQQLKDKIPFSLEDASINDTLEGRLANEARSDQVALIEEAALKAGLLGTRYYVTNIKRFSANSPLLYTDYFRGLAKEFNGHAVFFLGIEESDKVLLGDMAAEGTVVAAVRKVLGNEFLDTADIDIITDGGLKTRAGGSTALNGYNGLFPSAHGMPYYRRAMQLIAKARMQHPDYGKGKVYWTASDGDYQMGNMGYGQNIESNLKNDGTWSVVIHGVAEKIVPDNEKEELFSEVAQVVDQLNEIDQKYEAKQVEQAKPLVDALLAQYPAIKKGWEKINEKKLSELGENFSNPVTGRLVRFKEKPSPAKILLLLRENDTNSIIPNAFLLVFDQKAFVKHQDGLEAVDDKTGKALREYGGSYFDYVIGNQFEKSKAFNGLKTDAERDQIKAFHSIFPASQVIAANQGGIGTFTDRGKTEFLMNAYTEEIAASKRRGESGLIKRGTVNIGKNVILKVAPGATVILENVSIEAEGDQVIEVELLDNTFFHNTVLRLSNNAHFGKGTIIINSKIEGQVDLQPGNHDIVLEGVIFKSGQVQDINQDGQWENPQTLQLYSGELMVSILKMDGTRYINRGITKSNYKDEPLLNVFGGINNLEQAKALHPRLALNLPSATTKDWFNHTNWQGEGTQNVDVSSAKPYIDYVKMSQAINDIAAEIRDQDMAMTTYKTTIRDSEGRVQSVFRDPEGRLVNSHGAEVTPQIIEGKYVDEKGSTMDPNDARMRPLVDKATLSKEPVGGIDLNSRNLNLQSEGQKVNITFDPAMIAQFKRGDFSGVRIQILDVVPVNLMPLLGIVEPI